VYIFAETISLHVNNINISPALVLRLKGGEEHALREIFALLGPKVFNYCKKQVNNEEDAEELLQDIFLKIWQFRDKLDPSAGFEIILFTIARNHIINFARKRIGYTLTPSGELEPYENRSTEGDRNIAFQKIERQYQQVLEKLPPKRREIFEMSREHGLSNKEISAKMGISIRTVETHVSHVLSIMRNEFKDTYIFLVLFLIP
jgi:RNA polymerase sigma-70 factor (ECF subfamily)